MSVYSTPRSLPMLRRSYECVLPHIPKAAASALGSFGEGPVNRTVPLREPLAGALPREGVDLLWFGIVRKPKLMATQTMIANARSPFEKSDPRAGFCEAFIFMVSLFFLDLSKMTNVNCEKMILPLKSILG